jgi:hypothetical protein
MVEVKVETTINTNATAPPKRYNRYHHQQKRPATLEPKFN